MWCGAESLSNYCHISSGSIKLHFRDGELGGYTLLNIVQCSTKQYRVQYNTVQYSTQHTTVLYMYSSCLINCALLCSYIVQIWCMAAVLLYTVYSSILGWKNLFLVKICSQNKSGSTKNLCRIKVFVKKIFWKKTFGPKNVASKKILGPENFMSK